MDLVAIVVPVHGHAKVLVSILVNKTFVVFFENLCKMVGMLLPGLLDAKVVGTESEQERPPVMFPKARCDFALIVAVLVEAFFLGDSVQGGLLVGDHTFPSIY
jgi:hypothetical protein